MVAESLLTLYKYIYTNVKKTKTLINCVYYVNLYYFFCIIKSENMKLK